MEKSRIDYKQAYIYELWSNIDGVERKYSILKSYNTIIAIFNHDKTNEIYKNSKYYSVTTSRHYNCFLNNLGYSPEITIEMEPEKIDRMFYDLQNTEVEE